MSLTPQGVNAGLEWLSDLPNAPEPTKPRLGRLIELLADIKATDEEFLATCKASAGKDTLYPPNARLILRIQDARVEKAREEQARNWDPKVALPGGSVADRPLGVGPTGQTWTEYVTHIQDLVRRGFAGPGYMAKVIEELESGERPRYGPNLLAFEGKAGWSPAPDKRAAERARSLKRAEEGA